MTPFKRRQNPYIQRMAEDMQLRNCRHTIDAYTYHVDKFCRYFGKPADQLGRKRSASTSFIWSTRRKPRGVPLIRRCVAYVFSMRSPSATLGGPAHPFRQATEETARGSVRRGSVEVIRMHAQSETSSGTADMLCGRTAAREATHLRIADIDGKREQIHIPTEKGARTGWCPPRPGCSQELREYWKIHRPRNYLFPGKTPDVPLSSATIQKACKLAVAKAGISKTSHSAHDASLLCDGHARSGSRPADDQQAAGPLQLRDHDDLSARAASALRPLAQSDRLAAGSAVSAVGRAESARNDCRNSTVSPIGRTTPPTNGEEDIHRRGTTRSTGPQDVRVATPRRTTGRRSTPSPRRRE